MVGSTLVALRRQIETLASDDGRYYLVCARSGDRPVPAEVERFRGRTAARQAARATEQYRAALRRYDPRVPCYDVIVCEDADPVAASPGESASAGQSWSLTEPVLQDTTPGIDRPQRIEFCHLVAAAVFEELAATGHDDVERAVMDAYLDLAECVGDPDDLCLCLLESTTDSLADHLSPDEQATLLSRVASRMTPVDETGDPVPDALAAVRSVGLLGGYSWTTDAGANAGRYPVVADLEEYALAPRSGRLPVLPLALECLRRRPDGPPASLQVTAVDDGWRLRVDFGTGVARTGLASVPIRSEG